MVEFITEAMQQGQELSEEVRNLLSIAYKNVVGNQRSAWRAIANFEHKEQNVKDSKRLRVISWYRKKIEDNLTLKCEEILSLLSKDTFSKTQTPEINIFFMKMKADYLRYLCEFTTTEKLAEYVKDADLLYQKALTEAEKHLKSVNTLRLGLSLNASIFQYEILNNTSQAISIAKKAYHKIEEELPSMQGWVSKFNKIRVRNTMTLQQLCNF